MHWEILIIPLIALGVWIIGTLFKSEDDKTKKVIGRRPPFSPQNGGARGGVRGPGRRVVTDLDRFLEEARRRREPEERRTAPPPPSRTPARPPLRERPTPSQEPPRLATPVVFKEEVLVALPAPRPLAPPPAGGTGVSPVGGTGVSPVVEPIASPLSSREAPPRPAPLARSSPIAQQVRSLLSKPQTAATAFVLREIFDRPLCKRRR